MLPTKTVGVCRKAIKSGYSVVLNNEIGGELSNSTNLKMKAGSSSFKKFLDFSLTRFKYFIIFNLVKKNNKK